MYGYIYKTTCLVNNKIYIGQHKCAGPGIDTNYIGSGYLLKKAIQLHGRKNFKCELLEWAESSKDLDALEVSWIEKLGARNPAIGYNLAIGGLNAGLHDRGHSAESKQKMSTSMQNRCYVNKDGKIILISKKDLNDYKTNGWKSGLGNIWITKNGENKRIASFEIDDYLINGWQIGRNTTRTDQIICIETQHVWPSWKALAEELSLPAPGILSQYLDKRPYDGLHYCHKRIYDKMSEQARIEFLNIQTKDTRKAVMCIELNQTFNSIADAAKILDLSDSKISLVCNGFRKTHGGYHFKFIEE